MDVSKRIVTGEGFHVVFVPTITIKPKEQFGIATKYNTATKLQDYFFVDLATNQAYRVTHKTYDKLIAQSNPV
jgi:hypothetical protein